MAVLTRTAVGEGAPRQVEMCRKGGITMMQGAWKRKRTGWRTMAGGSQIMMHPVPVQVHLVQAPPVLPLPVPLPLLLPLLLLSAVPPLLLLEVLLDRLR